MYKENYFGHKDVMKMIENEAVNMGLKFAYKLSRPNDELRNLLIIANNYEEIKELNLRVFGV